jgi:hypothetical protein
MKNDESEKLLHESHGNYRENDYNPLNWTGGKWLLYNNKIVFQSGISNFQEIRREIRLEEILSIEAKHSNFISSKMIFFLNDGSTIELHVPNKSYWIDKIETAIKNKHRQKDDDWSISRILNTESKKSHIKISLQIIFEIAIILILSIIVTYIVIR